MSEKFAVIHLCSEHCFDQGGLLLTVNIRNISKSHYPLIPGKQILLRNPKHEGYSSGWVILLFDEKQNQEIHNFISTLPHPSYV